MVVRCTRENQQYYEEKYLPGAMKFGVIIGGLVMLGSFTLMVLSIIT